MVTVALVPFFSIQGATVQPATSTSVTVMEGVLGSARKYAVSVCTVCMLLCWAYACRLIICMLVSSGGDRVASNLLLG